MKLIDWSLSRCVAFGIAMGCIILGVLYPQIALEAALKGKPVTELATWVQPICLLLGTFVMNACIFVGPIGAERRG